MWWILIILITVNVYFKVYVSVQDMADTEAVNGATESQLPSEQALQMEEDERREEEERKKSREPPIVFKDAYDVIFKYIH